MSSIDSHARAAKEEDIALNQRPYAPERWDETRRRQEKGLDPSLFNATRAHGARDVCSN